MQDVETENLRKLAKRIKELRTKQAKSLNSFVMQKGGLTTATWSRLENAKYDPKFITLVKAASMLGITIEELLKDLNLNYTLEE